MRARTNAVRSVFFFFLFLLPRRLFRGYYVRTAAATTTCARACVRARVWWCRHRAAFIIIFLLLLLLLLLWRLQTCLSRQGDRGRLHVFVHAGFETTQKPRPSTRPLSATAPEIRRRKTTAKRIRPCPTTTSFRFLPSITLPMWLRVYCVYESRSFPFRERDNNKLYEILKIEPLFPHIARIYAVWITLHEMNTRTVRYRTYSVSYPPGIVERLKQMYYRDRLVYDYLL